MGEFMLVCCDREAESGRVAARGRTQGDIGVMSAEDFGGMAQRLVAARALTNEQV